MHSGETLMLYIQYQLRNSWGDPYKWAARGANTQILTKNAANIDIIIIMLKKSQFGSLE